MKILFVSLGCDKNLIDSEEMLGERKRKRLSSIPAVSSMTRKKRA